MVDCINMRKLMYILSKTLTIEGWHLFLTGVTVCVVVAGFVMNLNRARKKDFEKAMAQKADDSKVSEKFKTHEEKINNVKQGLEDHKQHNNMQFDSLEDKIDEFHATQNHVSERVDRIYEMLSKIAS